MSLVVQKFQENQGLNLLILEGMRPFLGHQISSHR